MSDQNVAVTVGHSSVATTVLFTPRDGLKKGPWTPSVDTMLIDYVKKHGEGKWDTVQKNSGLMRCAKSCRLRWRNHLRPNLKKGKFSPEEEDSILLLHAKLGNKWSTIAAKFPWRSDNEIKNYWNTRFKKLKRLGLPIYPPEAEKHFNPFNHRHNHHLNEYLSQLQNKNIMNQENPQPIEQTQVEPSPLSFESFQSPLPPHLLPQQPIHLTQNSSYIDNIGTVFDILSFPQPTQNLNPSDLTNSKTSQYFRVIENNYGGAGLNHFTKQPTLDHYGLATPNFPLNQFGSFNLTSSPNMFDFRSFQNSTMGVGVQSELHSIQSVHVINNKARVEFMTGSSRVGLMRWLPNLCLKITIRGVTSWLMG